ncbi:MAG: hypothetical protein P4L67_04740 [Candidatus Pacebacteria bacterium]|nr:hypothetical protein [Candidatus Paceibacterota bacterium]
MEQLSKQAKKTRRLVHEYRAAMNNIMTGRCSDLETRKVYLAGIPGGKACGKPAKQNKAKAS